MCVIRWALGCQTCWWELVPIGPSEQLQGSRISLHAIKGDKYQREAAFWITTRLMTKKHSVNKFIYLNVAISPSFPVPTDSTDFFSGLNYWQATGCLVFLVQQQSLYKSFHRIWGWGLVGRRSDLQVANGRTPTRWVGRYNGRLNVGDQCCIYPML